jgi:hypothetical protein
VNETGFHAVQQAALLLLTPNDGSNR